MNFLIFIPHLGVGGVEKSFFSLSEALIQEGHYVTIITLGSTSNSFIKKTSNIKIISAKKERTIFAIKYIIDYLNNNKPDVFISAQYYANIVAILASKLSKSKPITVISERLHLSTTLNAHSTLKRSILTFLIKRTYPKADLIFGNSSDVCEDLKDFLVHDNHKIKKILNPSDGNQILNLSKENLTDGWITRSSIPIILYVGRLVPQKDIGTLLNSFKILSKTIEAKLLIIGEGPDIILVKKFLKNNTDLVHKIRLEGPQQNPYKYFKYCKVFVLTSIYEGLPNVLIESQILGLPVVATDSPGGTKEVLQEGKSGLLAKIKDPNDVALNIQRLLKDKSLSREITINSKNSIERFAPKLATENLTNMISEIKDQV